MVKLKQSRNKKRQKRQSRAMAGQPVQTKRPKAGRRQRMLLTYEAALERVRPLHGDELLREAARVGVSTGGEEVEIKDRLFQKLTTGKVVSASKADSGRTPRVYSPEMVSESESELSDMIASGDYTQQQMSRIEALLLLKSGAANTCSGVQQVLGISWPTAQRWLKTYHDHGLSALLDIPSGGRKGLPMKVEKRIHELADDDASVAEILETLDDEGLNPNGDIEYIDIYTRVSRDSRNSFQTKMTRPLLDAIKAFCDAEGIEFSYPPKDSEWPDVLIERGLSALEGSDPDVKRVRSLVVKPREVMTQKAHFTKWVDDETAARLRKAKRAGESDLGFVRRILWAGLQSRKDIREVSALRVR